MVRHQEIARSRERVLGVGSVRLKAMVSASEPGQRCKASRTLSGAALKQLGEQGRIERRQGKSPVYRPRHVARNVGSTRDFPMKVRMAGACR